MRPFTGWPLILILVFVLGSEWQTSWSMTFASVVGIVLVSWNLNTADSEGLVQHGLIALLNFSGRLGDAAHT
jgi:hypothetical protein